MTIESKQDVQVRPFIKWAGGKTQLLPEIRDRFPAEFFDGKVKRYIEPFLGGGAVFLDIAQAFTLESMLLNDINPELVLAYQIVQQKPDELIELLDVLSRSYYGKDSKQRSAFFYSIRDKYNDQLNSIDFTRMLSPG